MAGRDKFSIEDAFQFEDDDGSLRVYGSTTENIPLTPPRDTDGEQGRLADSTNSRVGTYDGRFHDQTDGFQRSSSIHYIVAEDSTAYRKTFWWKHPKVQRNCKVVVMSILLFVVGIVLLGAGIAVLATKTDVNSVLFFVAGAICFIPGVYHVVYIYCAVKGHRGYTFQGLTIFK
ncbi:transmembrane protein 134 [Lamellibrachia satsuma]|nr:transmembrane protein 134 [Lamellibrachia satsuma]